MIRIDMLRQDTNHPDRRRRHQGRASCEVAGRRFEAEGPAPIYKLTTLLWLHGHGGAGFEVWDASAGRVTRPGERVSREPASQETTTPAALTTAACCSGVKSGLGFDFILNIGMPLGVSKLAQFRTCPRMARPLQRSRVVVMSGVPCPPARTQDGGSGLATRIGPVRPAGDRGGALAPCSWC